MIPDHTEIRVDGLSPKNAVELELSSDDKEQPKKKLKINDDNDDVNKLVAAIGQGPSAEEKALLVARTQRLQQISHREKELSLREDELSRTELMRKKCEAAKVLSESLGVMQFEIQKIQASIDACKDSEPAWAAHLKKVCDKLKKKMIELTEDDGDGDHETTITIGDNNEGTTITNNDNNHSKQRHE